MGLGTLKLKPKPEFTLKPCTQVAGYAGLLLATPTVLYEVVAYVLPGLTRSERRLLAPIIFGSSILFYLGCAPVHPLNMPHKASAPACGKTPQQCHQQRGSCH